MPIWAIIMNQIATVTAAMALGIILSQHIVIGAILLILAMLIIVLQIGIRFTQVWIQLKKEEETEANKAVMEWNRVLRQNPKIQK